MSASIVQSLLDQAPASGVDDTYEFNPTVPITAGNTVIIGVSIRSSGTIDSISDSIGGAWTQIIGESGWTFIFAYRNHPGGNPVITIDRDSINNIGFCFYEVTGLSNSASISSAGPFTNTTTTTHFSAGVGSGLTGTGFILSSAGMGSGTPNFAGGAGYTLDTSAGSDFLQQHLIGTISGNRGDFTNATNITSHALMALFPESAATGLPFITVIGAKRM